MVFRCCVSFCHSTNKEITMHRFPYLDKEVYRIWLVRVGNEKLRKMEPEKVYRNFRVCHNHFSEYCIIVGPNKRMLKQRSLPTIGLPDFHETPTPNNSYLTWDEPMVIDLQPGPSQQIGVDEQENVASDQHSFDITSLEVLPEIQNVALDIATKSPTRQDVQLSSIHSPKGRQDLRRQLHSALVSRTTDLPPKSQKLYRIATNLRNISRQLLKENASVKRRLQKASKFIKTEEYVRSTVNRTSFNFIMSQLKLQKVRSTGCHFALEDKILALTLYKQGRRNYKLLETIFALPSKATLRKSLENDPIYCGINEEIMDTLKHIVSKLGDTDKYCIVMFDEISIAPNLQYYEGFQVFDEGERSVKFADHAMVFVARGIRKKWKQPLYFYFVESEMKQAQLIKTLKMVIRSVREIGLKVIATVFNQCTNNVHVMKELKRLTREEFPQPGKEDDEYFGVTVDGKVVPLYI